MINTTKILNNPYACLGDCCKNKGDGKIPHRATTQGVYCLNRYKGCSNSDGEVINTMAYLNQPFRPESNECSSAPINTLAYLRYSRATAKAVNTCDSEEESPKPKRCREEHRLDQEIACTDCGFNLSLVKRSGPRQRNCINVLSSRNLINNVLCHTAGRVKAF